jgi:hypothetical protein
MKLNNILKELGTRYFRISFVKVDGTFREISARIPKERHGKEGYFLIYDNKDKTLKTVLEKNVILIKQGKKFWR